MKPLKLVMSGFGPFADREEIDFEKEKLSGVFLITGDTGAGKTTIFDAISFALYGEASGEWRSNDSFRSGYALPETKTFVELTFLQKGKRYHIERNPEYQRLAKRGNGLTKEKQDAWLEYPDGTSVGGFKKVNEAVWEILGIDRKQFKQIAMIAQGEFLKLLTANSKERGEIFRKVFDTELYLNLQKKLAEKEREYAKICEKQDQKIFHLLEDIEQETEFEDMDCFLEARKVQNHKEARKLLDCLVIWEREKEAQQQSVLEEKEIEISEQKEGLGRAKQREELFEKLEEEQKKLNELEDRKDEEERKKKRLILAEKAFLKVFPAEQKWMEAKEKAEKGKKELEESKKKLEEEEKTGQEWRKKEQEWKEKATEIEKQREKIRNLEQELPIRSERKKLQNELIHLQEKKETLRTQREKKQKQQESLIKEQEALQEWIEEHGSAEEKEKKCQIQREEAQNQKKEIWNLWEEKRKVDKLCKEENKMQDDYKNQEKIWEEKVKEFAQTEQQFFGNLAGILAEKLTEGEPCPVCGAIHHPKKAQMLESSVTEEKWKQLREEKERCTKELYRQKKELEKKQQERQNKEESFQEQIKKLRMEIEKKIVIEEEEQKEAYQNFQILEKLESQIQEQLKEIKKEEERWKELIKEKQKKQEQIHSISKQMKELQDNISEAREEEEKYEGQIQKYKGNIEIMDRQFTQIQDAEEEPEEILKELKQSVTEFECQAEKIKRGVKETEEAIIRQKERFEVKKEEQSKREQNEEKWKEEWKNKRENQGFLTEQSYRDAFLKEENIKELREELERRLKEKEELKLKIKEKEQLLGESTREDLRCREQNLRQAEKEKQRMEKMFRELSSRTHRNQKIQKQILELEEKQKKERAVYVKYKELSDTANGTIKGNEKLAFEQYVQSFYFRQVVQKANQRFYKMSGGQYELRCVEQAQDKKKSAGLDLEIMDYYIGSVRPIKSLSGGESFQAALALALGFSDVVQSYAGGIEVDAVFIDEGFGSLDSNALECAVQVLTDLSGESRMVGIISHVSELKERIEKKVELTKTIHGSTITVND